MADGGTRRSVAVERTAPGHFRVTNVRGGEITIGRGDGTDFTPTELLLAAIGGCTSIDVDILTSRRSEPESFVVEVSAEKVRDDDGNRMDDIEVTFRVTFGENGDGEAAREVLAESVRRSHDRLCTVSRTVELGTAIATRIV